MKFKIEDLRSLSILEGLPKEILAWLSDHGDRIELATGDHLFTRDYPADYMFIVVTGRIHRYQEMDGQKIVAATTQGGQVTGMLPFSRMTHYPGNAIAAESSLVLRINTSDFNDMLAVSHELGQRLVGEMSNRVRGDVRLEQQREKMVSLGRLAAGLAHEINNPVAAIQSTVTNLKDCFDNHSTFLINLARNGTDDKLINAIEQLLRLVQDRNFPKLSAFQRSTIEEEITDWLENHAVDKSWELATTFTFAGLGISDIQQFAAAVPQDLLGDALKWTADNIEVNRMVGEIKYSAERVSELISSVKDYSHMDQSPDHKPTDVCQGLDNTLIIFANKLRQKNIRVTKNYRQNLPRIPGNAGELNQVWTHLIDNAIDAMAENGELCIEAVNNDLSVDVMIIDNGEGIPDDIRHRIFDPFFTTKGVGKGTGLGLDIARRIVQTHQGQIEVLSRPGRTEMLVRLPIAPVEL